MTLQREALENSLRLSEAYTSDAMHRTMLTGWNNLVTTPVSFEPSTYDGQPLSLDVLLLGADVVAVQEQLCFGALRCTGSEVVSPNPLPRVAITRSDLEERLPLVGKGRFMIYRQTATPPIRMTLYQQQWERVYIVPIQ